MKSLIEIIEDAAKKGVAIGHFNFAEPTVLRAAMATDNGLKDKNNPARPAMLEKTIMTEKD